MATSEASQRAAAQQNVGVTRRGFSVGLAAGWALFSMGALLGVAGMVRFLFPNVLFEPPTSFKAGPPDDYGMGVDERFKDEHGTWMVRTESDPLSGNDGIPGMYALSTTCTHLGCIPNYQAADRKFKCPCHGSGFRESGINFEGPAPRPLERWSITFADDAQVFVDKSKKYQWEKGQWTNPEAYLRL